MVLAGLGEAFGWTEDALLGLTGERMMWWHQALLDLQEARRPEG